MKLRTLETVGALEALAPAWHALWADCPAATPFQSPDWLVPCARHRPGGALRVHLLEQDGAPAAVLPLATWSDGAELLGAGISDYGDLLVVPEAREEVRALLPDLLAGEPPVTFAQVPSGSPLLHVEPARGGSRAVTRGSWCPALPLAGGLAARVPVGQCRKLAQARRQAERAGGLAYERAPVETLLAELFALHAARWQHRGEPGVLGEPLVQALHREAAARFAAHGLLVLRGLSLGGERIAVFYGFRARARLCFYLAGFLPAAAPRSPGLLLLGAVMEEAAAEGVTLFDFLRGQEHYKYAWGAADVATWNVALAPS